MIVLSLFDGISCAREALKKSGIDLKTYYSSEIDEQAIKIAQKNHPDTIQLGNITTVNTPMLLTKNIDLLIGGSFCQDLSIAKNNRQGLKGARSGLFYEYLRILKETKPKYFILENVASMPQEARDEISKQMGVQPIMINAAIVSAQTRKRLFWTNIPNVTHPDDRNIYLKDIIHENTDGRETKEYIVLEKAGYKEKLKSNTVRSSGRGSGLHDKHNWDTIRIGHFNKGGQGDRVYSIEGKSICLSANGGGRGAKTGLYLINEYIRKLTPIECERLQGLPDNYTEGASKTQRYKMLGNAFNVDVISHLLSFLPKKTKTQKQGIIASV